MLNLAKSGAKELRFLFCVESGASQGLRSFVKKNFTQIQLNNKDSNVLMRYGKGTEARVLVGYPRLKEKIINVDNLSEAQIETELKNILA